MFFDSVILDRGHGLHNRGPGVDPGAVGPTIAEHTLASFVAGGIWSLAPHFLKVPIYLAPEESIGDVVNFANRVAKRTRPIVVSLHLNSSSDRDATGVEVVIGANAPQMRRLQAETFGREIAKELGLRFRRVLLDTETPKGEKDGLPIVRDTTCPAFLVELGFVSNPSDAAAVELMGAEAVTQGLRALALAAAS